jgi:hypothetical protein
VVTAAIARCSAHCAIIEVEVGEERNKLDGGLGDIYHGQGHSAERAVMKSLGAIL